MDENNHKRAGFKIFDDDESFGTADEGTTPSDEDVIAGGPEAPADRKPPRSKGVLFAFLIVLAFGVTGAMMYLGYTHLNDRLNRVEAVGAHEIAGMSEEIDNRLGVFSTRFASLHTEMQAQIETLEKRVADNQSALENHETAIHEQRQTASDSISALENRLAEITSRLDSRINDVQDVQSETAGRTDALENRVAQLADAVDMAWEIALTMEALTRDLNRMVAHVDDIEAQFETFAPDAIKQDVTRHVDEQMDRIQQDVHRQIEAIHNRMDQKTGALEDDIETLEAMLQSMEMIILDSYPSQIIEQELR